MRVSGLRILALIFAMVTMWIFIRSFGSFNVKTVRLPRWLGSVTKQTPVVKNKCGLSKPCPGNFFAFKICSGAANVVGPSMCFENHMIMSPVKNNVGRGLNIALVNGSTGMVHRQSSFDMYSGGCPAKLGQDLPNTPNIFQIVVQSVLDTKFLVRFLREIPDGTLVLVASYDDPGTKMNAEIRTLLSNLGSSYAKQVGFRDSWVFLGARDLKSKSPFEQYLKNNPDTNKYEGWPELLELEGCVPRRAF